MVDQEARAELRIALRRLVTGRMTNDQFDDLYFEQWENSEDGAVKDIAEFGYGLYSSDVFPYRLKGCYAASPEERKYASRCILFLYTDRTYEWPELHGRGVPGCFVMLDWICGMLGVALLIIAGFGALARDASIVWSLGTAGIFALSISVASLYLFGNIDFRRQKELELHGEFEVWPFLRQSDLEKSKQVVQLFGSGCT